MHKIDKMISEIDINLLKSCLDTGDIEPRPYQWLIYKLTGDVIRHYVGPSYVTASVGSGKSLMIAMIAKRFQEMGYSGMILSRQGEIVEQDAEELWSLGVRNSLFSASLGRKSSTYQIICGSEGTVVNALFDEKDESGNVIAKGALSDFYPRFLLIDENHMVNDIDVVNDGDTQYAVIINELMKRCKDKHGHELRIIGYTGSPFRGTTSIKGAFWKKEIINIDTKYMVENGFLVPTIFGLHDVDSLHYDLSDFHGSDVDGTQDFTTEQLKQMQKEILEQGTLTQKIMLKVMELTKDRNGVLITCAGKKHCQEAAKYLPEGSYSIVTEDMGPKARRKALKDAYTGRKKFTFQIAALTTGVNIPLWDTSCILRKIMSLTLLVQLLGRGMRLLKKEQIDAGYHKEDHLVLDFSGTMFELGQLYEDPILEEAEAQRSKRSGEQVPCPECGTMNSPYARRCIGKDALSPDGRCEEFFSFIRCGFDKHGIRIFDDGCGAKNDQAARYCRQCDHVLRDPNAALNERAYTDKEWTDVQDFKVELTKDAEGVLYRYLVVKADGKTGWANEVFYPFGGKPKHLRDMFKMKALLPHLEDKSMLNKMMDCHDAKTFMHYAGLIRAPKRITHRFNDKGRDIIHRKDFIGEQIEAA
ncbi:helicase [Aeromonas phage pIS4-A]|uniref:Helicase n=2 Tax=Roufvirus pIS4A TaxID=1982371 RepID=R9TPT1_9CAUD|nr:helicase [Vibrio phage pYD38-A]YP_009614669.1 helicase [Aeromonas phage pIS4-A]AGN34120.1 helicase [Aeromonas phage pIS4-A]AGN34299.1 helicase [Vibrio phage pYD38-A]